MCSDETLDEKLKNTCQLSKSLTAGTCCKKPSRKETRLPTTQKIKSQVGSWEGTCAVSSKTDSPPLSLDISKALLQL